MVSDMYNKVRAYLKGRSGDYKEVFRGVHGERVLQDLAKFCRANESTFHPDPRVDATLDGRREVWLRIYHHLNLDPDDLVKIYNPTEHKRNDRPSSDN